MFKSLVAGALALAIAAAAVASPALADRLNRVVTINNYSNAVLVEFRASNVGDDYWSHDILGEYRMLYPGQSVSVNFDDKSGYCKFDFKATFSDGYNTWDKYDYGHNVCRLGTFTYTR